MQKIEGKAPQTVYHESLGALNDIGLPDWVAPTPAQLALLQELANNSPVDEESHNGARRDLDK